MNPIVRFEISADDVLRTKKFYEDTFGWEIQRFEMDDGEEYWVVTATNQNRTPVESGAINGNLMKRGDRQSFTKYIRISSIDEARKVIEKNKGKRS